MAESRDSVSICSPDEPLPPVAVICYDPGTAIAPLSQRKLRSSNLGRTNMAKKKSKSTTKRPSQPAPVATPKSKEKKSEKNVPISKQTAGGVTGAIFGAAVAGPLGAIAGGLTGAMVGDASAKGKKPVKRAIEGIRSEMREVHIADTLKSVTERVTTKIKSFRKGKKSNAAATKKKSAAPVAATTKKSKSKPAKKKANTATKKVATTPKKKRANKKS
jgi:hypothetical protein